MDEETEEKGLFSDKDNTPEGSFRQFVNRLQTWLLAENKEHSPVQQGLFCVNLLKFFIVIDCSEMMSFSLDLYQVSPGMLDQRIIYILRLPVCHTFVWKHFNKCRILSHQDVYRRHS